ncbi:MAG: hypothetical protein MUP14_00060 [Dehalococcoidia bacterium]|nr:hypothetical protein [Dehalococcoidia bacterium]
MSIVIAKDVLAVLVASMVSVANCPGFFAIASRPDLEVFADVKDDVFVTENIPRDLTSFWGSLDAQRVINYEWVVLRHSQRDVQIVFEVVPTVLFRHVQGSSGPRSHGAT